MASGVLHYPRLDTVLMVEDCIRCARDYPARMELWRSLPKKVQYQTFQLILSYLLSSNKIVVTGNGKIMWIMAESKAAEKLVKTSKAYRSKPTEHINSSKLQTK